MTDIEQLNRKLVEWAIPGALEFDVKEGHIWVITDEGTAVIDDYFTQSLDACFKHLVPKAREEFGEELIDLLALELCLAIEERIDIEQLVDEEVKP